jgi:hypothetical protein
MWDYMVINMIELLLGVCHTPVLSHGMLRAGLRVMPMTMVGVDLCIVVQQQIQGIALVWSCIEVHGIL